LLKNTFYYLHASRIRLDIFPQGHWDTKVS
jgi:hypothetical protein